jgi:hypothetical protein
MNKRIAKDAKQAGNRVSGEIAEVMDTRIWDRIDTGLHPDFNSLITELFALGFREGRRPT